MKYLFMYELYHRLHLVGPGLEVRFIRYHYGPYAHEIQSTLDLLSDFDYIQSSTYLNSYGNQAQAYMTDAVADGLTDDELEIADYVMSSMKRLRFKSMINKVYSTPPMLDVLAFEEMLGARVEGTDLDMDHVKGTFKRTPAGRDAARRRLMELSPKGSDSEYNHALTEEYRMTEQLRRRASSVVDKPRS